MYSMKYFNRTSLSLALVCLMGYLSMYNSTGSHSSNGGRTGASFDNGTCATGSGCHNSAGTFTPTTSIQLLDGTTPVTSYTANHNYTLRITISASGTNSSTRYGFQAVSIQSGTNNDINGWGTMPTGTKTVAINGRTYGSHSTRLTNNIINIPWTSPATSTGNIVFYASGLVANGNLQQTGDNVDTDTLTITANTSGCSTPLLFPTVTHVKCNGDTTGAISIGTVGGSVPFTFSWTSNKGFTSTQKDLVGIPAGQYQFIVTASGGCKDTLDLTVNEPPVIVPNPSPDLALCIGDTISISSNATGGTGTLSYSWMGPGGFSSGSSSSTIPNAGYAQSGNYIVSVTDTNNCTVQDTVMVRVDSMPMADNITMTPLTGDTYGFGLANARFVNNVLWNFGDGKTGTAQALSHTYTTFGVFTVSAIISNQCGSDTVAIQIALWPASIANTSKKDDMLKVFPNPANDHITIATVNELIDHINITSIEGRVVYKNVLAPTNRATINTSNYPNGMYILQVSTNKGSYQQHLNITH